MSQIQARKHSVRVRQPGEARKTFWGTCAPQVDSLVANSLRRRPKPSRGCITGGKVAGGRSGLIPPYLARALWTPPPAPQLQVLGCASESSRVLLGFLGGPAFICCGLAKCAARIFTACFTHGHLSTQATCLPMPALRFLKIPLKRATVLGCAVSVRRPGSQPPVRAPPGEGCAHTRSSRCPCLVWFPSSDPKRACSPWTCCYFGRQNPLRKSLLCFV